MTEPYRDRERLAIIAGSPLQAEMLAALDAHQIERPMRAACDVPPLEPVREITTRRYWPMPAKGNRRQRRAQAAKGRKA